MSTAIRRRWLSEHAGSSRKDNRGCEYEAFQRQLSDPERWRA